MARDFTSRSFTDSGAGNFTPDAPGGEPAFDIYNRNDVGNYTETSGGITATTLDTGYVLPVVASIDSSGLEARPETYFEPTADPATNYRTDPVSGNGVISTDALDVSGKTPIMERLGPSDEIPLPAQTTSKAAPSKVSGPAMAAIGLAVILGLGWLTRGKG